MSSDQATDPTTRRLGPAAQDHLSRRHFLQAAGAAVLVAAGGPF